jgi:hypothetical protein
MNGPLNVKFEIEHHRNMLPSELLDECNHKSPYNLSNVVFSPLFSLDVKYINTVQRSTEYFNVHYKMSLSLNRITIIVEMS